MQLILLSGGSGKRLWPLSNESYSKQFLNLLPTPDGGRESMLQRIVRQINESGLDADVTIATGESQRDVISSQLGRTVEVVTEPERRDTFPAISLACSYLEKEKRRGRDEVVVVMPSDPYTDDGYFNTIKAMAGAVERGMADIVLMGIKPTNVSTKYGYIVPKGGKGELLSVERFTEKPNAVLAKQLIDGGALWNGGVFAFKLGYLTDIVRKYLDAGTFAEVRSRYDALPKMSFDYEVVEKASSIAVVTFNGMWKDLGTWNALSDVLGCKTIGNVKLDANTRNTHVVNSLDIPCVCVGVDNVIVATSPDGILVAGKDSSELIKSYVEDIKSRPMYEERRWGTYKVFDNYVAKDGKCHALTKHLCIKSGNSISYQRHFHRAEVWTFIDGTGKLAIDGKISDVKGGDLVFIKKGQLHAVKAVSDLHIIEVQIGDILTEEDIERFAWEW